MKKFFAVLTICIVVFSCLVIPAAAATSDDSGDSNYYTIHPIYSITNTVYNSLQSQDLYLDYSFPYNSYSSGITPPVEPSVNYIYDGVNFGGDFVDMKINFNIQGSYPLPLYSIEFPSLLTGDDYYYTGFQTVRYKDIYVNEKTIAFDRSKFVVSSDAKSITANYSAKLGRYVNGDYSTYNVSYSVDYVYDVNNDSVFSIPLFTLDFLSDRVGYEADTYFIEDYSVSIDFDSLAQDTPSYFGLYIYTVNESVMRGSGYNWNGDVFSYSDLPSLKSFNPKNDLSVEYVSLEDFDLISWLGDALDGFMQAEIMPGISLKIIFTAVVGLLLFMAFLQFFRF